MKRARGGEHGSQGEQGRGGQGAGRGGAGRCSAAKSDDPTKEIEDPSAVNGKGNNTAVKIEGNNTAVKIEIIEGFANTRWTDDERTILFDYYLGPESDEVFKGLKMNATHAHKKVRVSIHSCDISLF